MLTRNEESLIKNLEKLQRVIKKLEIQVARLHEIERTDLKIMMKMLEGPQEVQILAHAAGISSGAITYALNSLIKRNLCEKKKRATDQRKYTVTFTVSGRLKAEAIKNDLDDAMKNLLKPVDDFDKLILSNTINSIYDDVK